eukprot:CAMPEP_0204081332 /NCGR_PEP_ID=MMETSP0360-20130528/175365_1 /ASSEMBLY_ACC=CAM_ASM_000342 /TAXON_ID=268821 /ORGANISM="Scrippsiella Hangoei, Strain SHTV-5" /LENGTH=57 /DNA_ID=CAMNT_0051030149 /DNA_START=285 /DNA_END=455 /DNA_ORIENTATION=-
MSCDPCRQVAHVIRKRGGEKYSLPVGRFYIASDLPDVGVQALTDHMIGLVKNEEAYR